MAEEREGAFEKMVQAVRPFGLAMREAVGPTAKGTLCSREAHVPPTARGDMASPDWPRMLLSLLLYLPSSLSI